VMLMMQLLGMHGPSTTDRWGTGERPWIQCITVGAVAVCCVKCGCSETEQVSGILSRVTQQSWNLSCCALLFSLAACVQYVSCVI
jgi:hypothetical protein